MLGWLSANSDYLLVTLACVAVIGLLELRLRFKTPRSRLPLFVWYLLGVTLIAGWFFTDAAGDKERERLRASLEITALTYATELSQLGHAQVTLGTSPKNSHYLSLIEAEKRWKRANPAIGDLRTYRRSDERARIIVGAESDYNHDGKIEGAREQRIPIGQEYAPASAAIVQALEGTPTFSDEPVRDAWGEWVSLFVPVRDAQGRVEATLGVNTPAADWFAAITAARARAEAFLAVPLLILVLSGLYAVKLGGQREAQNETEAAFRRALDGLPLDLWTVDATTRATWFNAAARKKWGDVKDTDTSPTERSGTACRAEWEVANRRALAGESTDGEVAYEVGGRRRHFYRLVVPVRTDGAVTRVVGALLDITPRVEADEVRRKSEEKLALHVRHTPLAVIEWNLGFRVTAWNPAAEHIFGYTAAEAIGRHAVGFIVAESERSQMSRIWAALLAHKGGTRSANENITKDGRTIFCEWYNTPLVDESGAVIGVASSVQDATERELLQKQLHQAQKMESIGQLAGGVAHEFNNLLTPMLIQTDIIAQQYKGDSKLQALLWPMQNAIQQATQLNRRILAVGRRNAEQKELLSLNQLIENTLALLRPSLDRRIEFTVSLANNLEPLLLDRAHVAQIVMNLALNARDTLLEKLERDMPPGWIPRLSVITERAVDAVRRDGASAMPFTVPIQRLTVIDNGLGIAPELRPRIFEPFFTTKPAGRGTGLGLAVVWNVVHSVGGWIEVDHGPGGEGTRFQISIPIPQNARPAATVAPEEVSPQLIVPPGKTGPKSSRPFRILLAEDNALVAETFAAVLTTAGHDIVVAQDGEEAWELFNQRGGQFDVMLADFNMPRINGGELLRRVKASGFRGRVVIVSGYLTGEKVDELMRLGADGVLRKPFSPVALFAVLEGKGGVETKA